MSALPSWDELKAAAEEDARQAADEWLAGALRKLADDPTAIRAAKRAVDNPADPSLPLGMDAVIKIILDGVADHVEGKTREDR